MRCNPLADGGVQLHVGESVTEVIFGLGQSALYNSFCSGLPIEMNFLKHLGIEHRAERLALIVVAVCALTVSLATRYYIPPTSQVHSVKAIDRGSLDAKRQHLCRDATKWVAPPVSFVSLKPANPVAPLALADPLLSKHFFDQSLYNRPPPSSGFFL